MRYWYAVGPAMKLLRYDIEFLWSLWKIPLAVKRTPLAFDRTSLDFHTIDCLFLFCKLSFFSYLALALCPFTFLYSLGYSLHPSVFNRLLITFIICRAKQTVMCTLQWSIVGHERNKYVSSISSDIRYMHHSFGLLCVNLLVSVDNIQYQSPTWMACAYSNNGI